MVDLPDLPSPALELIAALLPSADAVALARACRDLRWLAGVSREVHQAAVTAACREFFAAVTTVLRAIADAFADPRAWTVGRRDMRHVFGDRGDACGGAGTWTGRSRSGRAGPIAIVKTRAVRALPAEDLVARSAFGPFFEAGSFGERTEVAIDFEVVTDAAFGRPDPPGEWRVSWHVAAGDAGSGPTEPAEPRSDEDNDEEWLGTSEDAMPAELATWPSPATTTIVLVAIPIPGGRDFINVLVWAPHRKADVFVPAGTPELAVNALRALIPEFVRSIPLQPR